MPLKLGILKLGIFFKNAGFPNAPSFSSLVDKGAAPSWKDLLLGIAPEAAAPACALAAVAASETDGLGLDDLGSSPLARLPADEVRDESLKSLMRAVPRASRAPPFVASTPAAALEDGEKR